MIFESQVKVEGWWFNQFKDSVENAPVHMTTIFWIIIQWAVGLVCFAKDDSAAYAERQVNVVSLPGGLIT